jgi:cytochrome oxidase Cu insertion factor (SCO1/SenC/PrrC family)
MSRSARLQLIAILVICAAPVLASYLAYYVFQPQGRTNYGTLIEPQRGVGAMQAQLLDGGRFALADLRGKWVMLTVDAGACAQACVDKLYLMRQVRLTTGKDRDRIERVMLVTDADRPAPQVLSDYEGTRMARIDPDEVAKRLPPEGQGRSADHIYLIDPLGNLMMRFPRNADPSRMKKDLAKLLRASRVG